MISGFSLPSQIFQFISQLLNVYYFMIIARIILTWVVNSYSLERHPLGYWLCALTDPFLRIFRRLPFAVIGGVIDISPIFALFAISLIRRFFQTLAASQSAPVLVVLLGLILRLIISVVSIVKTVAIVIALLFLFRLLYLLFSKRPSYNTAINHIDFYIRKLIQGPLKFLNLQSSKFTTQVTSVFVVAVLLSYLLVLSEALLANFFQGILTSL